MVHAKYVIWFEISEQAVSTYADDPEDNTDIPNNAKEKTERATNALKTQFFLLANPKNIIELDTRKKRLFVIFSTNAFISPTNIKMPDKIKMAKKIKRTQTPIGLLSLTSSTTSP